MKKLTVTQNGGMKIGFLLAVGLLITANGLAATNKHKTKAHPKDGDALYIAQMHLSASVTKYNRLLREAERFGKAADDDKSGYNDANQEANADEPLRFTPGGAGRELAQSKERERDTSGNKYDFDFNQRDADLKAALDMLPKIKADPLFSRYWQISRDGPYLGEDQDMPNTDDVHYIVKKP